jgi:hypothetical protein
MTTCLRLVHRLEMRKTISVLPLYAVMLWTGIVVLHFVINYFAIRDDVIGKNVLLTSLATSHK